MDGALKEKKKGGGKPDIFIKKQIKTRAKFMGLRNSTPK